METKAFGAPSLATAKRPWAEMIVGIPSGRSPPPIYSLIDLREIMLGCNRRYLTHLSALTSPPGFVPSAG
jgi:hypothetical protein